MKTIYLAAAVDLAKTDPFQLMADKLKPATCFMPRSAFANAVDGLGDEYIVRINAAALKEADMVVALVDGETPSIGMPMEILLAASHNIPVIVVDASKDLSLMGKSIYTRVFASGIIPLESLNYELVNNIVENNERGEEIKKLLDHLVFNM